MQLDICMSRYNQVIEALWEFHESRFLEWQQWFCLLFTVWRFILTAFAFVPSPLPPYRMRWCCCYCHSLYPCYHITITTFISHGLSPIYFYITAYWIHSLSLTLAIFLKISLYIYHNSSHIFPFFVTFHQKIEITSSPHLPISSFDMLGSISLAFFSFFNNFWSFFNAHFHPCYITSLSIAY